MTIKELNSKTLLANIINKGLYIQLINQLNKDFSLIGLEILFDKQATPIELKEKLQEVVKDLILNSTDDYYSLLYHIDVSETA